MLVVIFPTRSVKILLFFTVSFFRLIRQGKHNFMLTSGSHKMLKILIEIIVQVFHDNNFFRLDKFGAMLYWFIGPYCAFRLANKVCVLRVRGT